MAVVDLNKAPLSENGRLAILRSEKLAERLASRSDYLGTESAESILRVVRELAESEAKLRQRCEMAEAWLRRVVEAHTGENVDGCDMRNSEIAAIDRAGGGERENGDG
jgi:hypothetical protein